MPSLFTSCPICRVLIKRSNFKKHNKSHPRFTICKLCHVLFRTMDLDRHHKLMHEKNSLQISQSMRFRKSKESTVKDTGKAKLRPKRSRKRKGRSGDLLDYAYSGGWGTGRRR